MRELNNVFTLQKLEKKFNYERIKQCVHIAKVRKKIQL